MNGSDSGTSVKGSSKKKSKEIKVNVSKGVFTIEQFVQEDLIKKHMNNSKSYPKSKLYSKSGMQLQKADMLYLKTGDVVYLARHGEAFDY
jgi:hypothetical protein